MNALQTHPRFYFCMDKALKSSTFSLAGLFSRENLLLSFLRRESLTDYGITQILGSLIEGVSKPNEINLKQFSFGFGGGNKITDESLFALTKTLISLSSKTDLTRLSLYLNRQIFKSSVYIYSSFFQP